MTTIETPHRASIHAERAGDSPGIDPAAVGLADRLAELGEPISAHTAAELLERIQRQNVDELYWVALNASVSAQRAREARREARRLRAQEPAK